MHSVLAENREAKAMSPTQLALEVQDPFRGREVLRAAPVPEGGYRILSVPVLVAGISRGAIVDARQGPERLVVEGIRRPSPGATVRCVASNTYTLRSLCDEYLDPTSSEVAARLGLGPASLYEPEVVAVHVRDREALPKVAIYLDHLILLGALRSWEPGDPGLASTQRGAESDPVEYVHSPADEWTEFKDGPAKAAASRPTT